MILTALGWLAALGLLAIAVSSGWRGWREKARGPWIAAGLYAFAAVVLLGIDGILRPLSAGVLAFLVLAAVMAPALGEGRKIVPDNRWKGAALSARYALSSGPRYLARDAGSISRRATGRGEDEPAETEAIVSEHIVTRNIPPVMADPVLGVAPEPAALATAAPVPAPYAAMAAYIAGFVPEDDQALKMFMQANAAGELAIADAWHTFGDTCLNEVGLDPAYVAGLLEAGDGAAIQATLLAMVHKRFGVLYAAVQEWISAGRQLPHKAREFLTGEAA